MFGKTKALSLVCVHGLFLALIKRRAILIFFTLSTSLSFDSTCTKLAQNEMFIIIFSLEIWCRSYFHFFYIFIMINASWLFSIYLKCQKLTSLCIMHAFIRCACDICLSTNWMLKVWQDRFHMLHWIHWPMCKVQSTSCPKKCFGR